MIGANEAGRGRDLGFAALDPSPAVALKVLLGCQGQVGRMGIPVVRIVPLDAAEQAGDPRVLGLQIAHPELGVELENAGDDLGDQGLLHFDPMTGDVPVKPVLPVEHVHVGVPGACPFMEAPGDIQFLMQAV